MLEQYLASLQQKAEATRVAVEVGKVAYNLTQDEIIKEDVLILSGILAGMESTIDDLIVIVALQNLISMN